MVWASSRSLATTWEITELFLVPPPTEMFQFGGFAFPKEYPGKPEWVAPFGHPWINASLQLPTAFRSLARPSSPLHA